MPLATVIKLCKNDELMVSPSQITLFVVFIIVGAAGRAFTIIVNVASSAIHGSPNGLLVVTVMVIVFPISALTGVYSIINGLSDAELLVNVPLPLEVMLTDVAEPAKVLPPIVTLSVLEVEVLVVDNVATGGLEQAQTFTVIVNAKA